LQLPHQEDEVEVDTEKEVVFILAFGMAALRPAEDDNTDADVIGGDDG